MGAIEDRMIRRGFLSGCLVSFASAWANRRIADEPTHRPIVAEAGKLLRMNR